MAENTKDITVYVDGESITVDKLTFRERRELRKIALELAEDPDADDYTVDDAVMAMVAVAKRRKDPDFDAQVLLDRAPDDYLIAPPTSEASTKPKGAAAKSKTR
ncbi:MAG: hypothetical protein Q8O56_13925 [Solirubrobacteraceae bacterium]|nr:hypothetical protein [Solirubrobacteraceae bacterium]